VRIRGGQSTAVSQPLAGAKSDMGPVIPGSESARIRVLTICLQDGRPRYSQKGGYGAKRERPLRMYFVRIGECSSPSRWRRVPLGSVSTRAAACGPNRRARRAPCHHADDLGWTDQPARDLQSGSRRRAGVRTNSPDPCRRSPREPCAFAPALAATTIRPFGSRVRRIFLRAPIERSYSPRGGQIGRAGLKGRRESAALRAAGQPGGGHPGSEPRPGRVARDRPSLLVISERRAAAQQHDHAHMNMPASRGWQFMRRRRVGRVQRSKMDARRHGCVAPNWCGLMANRRPHRTFTSWMSSLDPATVGRGLPRAVPGEVAGNRRDHQHPHDFFMQAAASGKSPDRVHISR
jgi:hypothetical protein